MSGAEMDKATDFSLVDGVTVRIIRVLFEIFDEHAEEAGRSLGLEDRVGLRRERETVLPIEDFQSGLSRLNSITIYDEMLHGLVDGLAID
jgi:hypothetical protein